MSSVRSRTATPGYRSSTASHRARSRAGKRSSCETPSGVERLAEDLSTKQKSETYSIAPWIRALKDISPLTNPTKTKEHFPETYCRFGSEEWRTRPKRRMGGIPLQSHDRTSISDSHLLRTFKDDREAPCESTQRAATAAEGTTMGRNRRERHWGLVPQLPNVGWSDSNLTRKMADFHVGKQAKDQHGGNVFGRSGAVPIGRNTFPVDHFTESCQLQNVKAPKQADDVTKLSSVLTRPELAKTSIVTRAEALQPRELWSRGSDLSLRSATGLPAKSQIRPQDAVFAGRAALGRVGKQQFKDRFRSPYATHVAPVHDFNQGNC